MKAELQKRDQELAAEKSKSLEKNNEYRTQIKLLCAQCSNLTDCNTALAASNTTLQTAHRDLTSELRAHKGALDIAREELTESRKEANTFYKATLKQDEEYKLLKEQLKEAKADEVVQWRMLTNRLRLLGKSHEMGRVVYELLLLQVEGQYGGDRVVLERVKRALEEAFGEFFARE
jgi:DNA repair exonuclease SbcCD ATPase subunit